MGGETSLHMIAVYGSPCKHPSERNNLYIYFAHLNAIVHLQMDAVTVFRLEIQRSADLLALYMRGVGFTASGVIVWIQQ